MIKMPITYTDYNGEEQTEDFYFNLNKAEVMDLNFNANGSYGEYLKSILNSRDYKQMGEEFKKLILRSYGEKSPDGRRFVKTPEKTAEFEQTEAYSELYIMLATDPKMAEKFVNGVLPKVSNGAPLPEKSGN